VRLRPLADIATPLRRHRLALGLTQQQLAEAAGLSIRGLSDLEYGRRNPRTGTADRLAQALRVEPWALFWDDARPVGSRIVEVPAGLNRFIGRREELRRIRGELTHPQTRLLTLVGAPGVGKTRLAREVAESLVPAFLDGVAFVRLCVLDSTRDVPALVARALHCEGAEAQADIYAALQERRLLLVLDNTEHLPGLCDLVVDWLEAHSGLTILATGRQPLDASGEHVREIRPLPIPISEAMQDVTPAASAQLFVVRARQCSPFVQNEYSAPLVARICGLVDGLPLALELAAGRLRDTSLDEIVADLQRSVPLAGGPADRPQRLRSISAAVDWSVDRLEAPVRDFVARLAVFVGLYTVDAAAAVTGVDVEQAARFVTELRTRHLLLPTPHSEVIMMVAAIRAAMLERLAVTDQLGTYRDAHARHYLMDCDCERARSLRFEESVRTLVERGIADNVRHATAINVYVPAHAEGAYA